MHDESSITPAKPRDGVLSLTGYRVTVGVDRGHLTVRDGIGSHHREARFPRTTRELRRLVIIGRSGSVSFDALRWLHDRGCSFVQVDSDGTIIVASGPLGSDDARLRRAQAFALVSETGREIARELLSLKLDGQAGVLDGIEGASDAAQDVRRLWESLASADDLPAMRYIEAQAAAVYWAAWADVPVRISRRMTPRVPDHWRRFGSRSSPLTSSPRLATNPINAILNYLYAIVEAEARIALLAVGMDPGFGIVHADQRGRDSFACDVMEAVRPAVDAFVLELVQSRPFGQDDFFETRQGACRILPPVTSPLADTATRWAGLLAPVVDGIARRLLDAHGIPNGVGTLLTQANRRDGRARVKAAKRTASKARRQDDQLPARSPLASGGFVSPSRSLTAACQDCGVLLSNPERSMCDDCLRAYRGGMDGEPAAFVATGQTALAELRASGHDPAHGGAAGKARGKRNAAQYAALDEWRQASGDDPADGFPPDAGQEVFTRDILPGLQEVSIRELSDATGLTQGYCSFVRRGLRVPHRRHWGTFAAIAGKPTGEK